MRTTFPAPVLPSNVKKLANGASRTPSAFKISCASIPPTTAQTGANSCVAVVTVDLSDYFKYKVLGNSKRKRRPLDQFSRNSGERVLVDLGFRNESICYRFQFICVFGVVWQMALVGTLEFPQSCCIYMSAFATRQDNSVYLPRIVNTAAGFKLLVWRRGVLVHRCPRASRSGLYETVTLTSFAPSCFPPERSLGASRNPE